MTYEMTPYSNHPCLLKTFIINGIKASRNEFGYDSSSRSIEDLMRSGCTNHKFDTIPYDHNEETASKYNLTKDEYEKICEDLKSLLSIGCCFRCIL